MNYAFACLLAVGAVACTAAHRPDRIPAGDGPLVGVFEAVIDDGRGTVRHARLSVWAMGPDRLHAELHGPIGGVSLILDAGAGQVCIVDVAAGTAYVGRDDTGALESLVGVRVSVADAVAALLSGTAPDGVGVVRDDVEKGSLPMGIRIAEGKRSIELSRIRLVRGSADAGSLGTGAPPPRLTVRPIASLSLGGARDPAAVPDAR